jgi:hypothetical protein
MFSQGKTVSAKYTILIQNKLGVLLSSQPVQKNLFVL